MKTYIISTGSSVNEMLLHSTMKKNFITISEEDANKVFDNEVKTLDKTYIHTSKLDCYLSDKAFNHAISCTMWMFDDEIGEDSAEIIKESDYFYDKECL